MAVDQGLLAQQLESGDRAFLRFYTWAPVAISLGYHQRQWPLHWETITWQGYPLQLVQRPSGGRAVLHQGDLTYSVVLPWDGRGRQVNYRRICDSLIAGWQTLGVTLTYGQGGRGYIHRPDCFGTATPADLVTPAGYKLVGSAQVRRGAALLQQGSMRLWPDGDLHRQVFGQRLQPWAAPAWIQGATTTTARREAIVHIAAVLAAAIATGLGLSFQAQTLTLDQWHSIQRSIEPIPSQP